MTEDNGYYAYNPSKVAAIVFIVLFTAVFIAKLFFFIKFHVRTSKRFPVHTSYADSSTNLERSGRNPSIDSSTLKKGIGSSYYPSIPILIGILLELIGYIARTLSISDKENLGIFIVEQVIILISPSFIAGGIYMIFGRMKTFLDANDYAFVRSKYLTTILVIFDVFSALLQAAAGSLMSQVKTSNLGFNLAMVAFVIQVIVFGLFVIMVSRFMALLKQSPTEMVRFIDNNGYLNTTKRTHWRYLIWCLVVAMGLITVRCILRLIEFAQKTDGVLWKHEIAYYTIDALPIFVATTLITTVDVESVLWKLYGFNVWKHDSIEVDSTKADEFRYQL